ncbi:hypothetical protein EST38_g6620 [Candolleomyces aberdarensis]|uniref:Uncharacterized protein n=1 Tax=Candolleomyces aberdarensis TaxID=2316362 RepID=A0A4Q2DKI6_9AGAR|nr:hypothetical protein EST38_g6620 [Candolleomyces aberdarensis]
MPVTDSKMEELWRVAWVQKDRNRLYSSDPEGPLILNRMVDIGPDHPTKILVRREYVRALEDAATWTSGQAPEQLPTVYDEEDWTWQHWFFDEASPERMSFARLDKDHGVSLRDLDSKALGEVMQLPCDPSGWRRAFSVTGIDGKSLWLYFVLVERLLRNLPTLFQFEPNRILYFSNAGLIMISPDNNLEDAIFVGEMNPDTCRDIQDTSLWPDLLTITDSMVSNFCSRYGPSPRNLFKYGKNPEQYRELLGEMLKRLDGMRSFESLMLLAARFRVSRTESLQEMTRMIVGVFPGPTRDDVRANLQTKEIFEMVVNALGPRWDRRSKRIYSFFREKSCLTGAAGYILERALHKALLRGGQWKGTLMHCSKSDKNTYTDDPAEKPQPALDEDSTPGDQSSTSASQFASSPPVWLRVGPGVSVDSAEDPHFTPVPLSSIRLVSTDDSEFLVRKTYCQPTIIIPTSWAQDPALIVDPVEKVIMVFQCTLSNKLGTLLCKLAVELCQAQGYSIRYVFVTDCDGLRVRTQFVKVPAFPQAIDKYVARKVHVWMDLVSLFPTSG